MKYIHKLSVKIIVSIVIGFLLAGVGAKITYSCPPVDGAVGCVSFEKAIMHPDDLLNNKQDSLVRFSKTFVIASLASFAALSLFSVAYKRSKKSTK